MSIAFKCFEHCLLTQLGGFSHNLVLGIGLVPYKSSSCGFFGTLLSPPLLGRPIAAVLIVAAFGSRHSASVFSLPPSSPSSVSLLTRSRYPTLRGSARHPGLSLSSGTRPSSPDVLPPSARDPMEEHSLSPPLCPDIFAHARGVFSSPSWIQIQWLISHHDSVVP